MRLEPWQSLGVICGALLALLTLLGLLRRKVVLPVWRAVKMWTRVAEQLLGDREHGTPSLMEQLNALAENQQTQARQLAEHLEWHSDPRGQPAKPVRSQPNSSR